MSKRSAPFTTAVVITLMLATIVISIIALSSRSSNKLIQANIIGARAPACGPAIGKFDLVNNFDIVGNGTAPTKKKAIIQAEQDLKSKQQNIDISANPKLSCGQGCIDDTTTCQWEKIDCEARESTENNWRAVCAGEVKCSKTCNKE